MFLYKWPCAAPYGLREGSRKGGDKDANVHWDITNLFDEMLHFAAQHLVRADVKSKNTPIAHLT
jgi:hypothetical protein